MTATEPTTASLTRRPDPDPPARGVGTLNLQPLAYEAFETAKAILGEEVLDHTHLVQVVVTAERTYSFAGYVADVIHFDGNIRWLVILDTQGKRIPIRWDHITAVIPHERVQ